jgi:hypothetical protein
VRRFFVVTIATPANAALSRLKEPVGIGATSPLIEVGDYRPAGMPARTPRSFT